MDWRPIEPCALASDGTETLAEIRGIDNSENRLPIPLQRDRHTERRKPGGEICSAIERIYNPSPLTVVMITTRLLRDNPMLREMAPDITEDKSLRLLVGYRDNIAVIKFRRLLKITAAEIAHLNLTGTLSHRKSRIKQPLPFTPNRRDIFCQIHILNNLANDQPVAKLPRPQIY